MDLIFKAAETHSELEACYLVIKSLRPDLTISNYFEVYKDAHKSDQYQIVMLKSEEVALRENCQTLRLCTGIENESGVRFYEKNGWSKRAYAFTKKPKRLKLVHAKI